jgi:hypothetical protein
LPEARIVRTRSEARQLCCTGSGTRVAPCSLWRIRARGKKRAPAEKEKHNAMATPARAPSRHFSRADRDLRADAPNKQSPRATEPTRRYYHIPSWLTLAPDMCKILVIFCIARPSNYGQNQTFCSVLANDPRMRPRPKQQMHAGGPGKRIAQQLADRSARSPAGELPIDPVADERLVRATARVGRATRTAQMVSELDHQGFFWSPST